MVQSGMDMVMAQHTFILVVVGIRQFVRDQLAVRIGRVTAIRIFGNTVQRVAVNLQRSAAYCCGVKSHIAPGLHLECFP